MPVQGFTLPLPLPIHHNSVLQVLQKTKSVDLYTVCELLSLLADMRKALRSSICV